MEDFRNYTTVIDTQYVRFGEMGRSKIAQKSCLGVSTNCAIGLGTALKHYGLAKEVIIERKKSKSKTYSDLIHGVEIGHDVSYPRIIVTLTWLILATGPHGFHIYCKALP